MAEILRLLSTPAESSAYKGAVNMEIKIAQAEYDAVCSTLKGRMQKADASNAGAFEYVTACKAMLARVVAEGRPDGDANAQVERTDILAAAYAFLNDTAEEWQSVKRAIEAPAKPGPAQTAGM